MPKRNNQQSLHIGLVGPLPPPYGGMANQLKQLQQLLKQENIQVTLVQTNPPYGNRLVSRIKGVRAIYRLVPYFYRLWKLAGHVDVIHVLSNSGWSWQLFSAPVLWLAAIRKTPVIINYRGGEAESYFKRSIMVVRPSMNLASQIIVPSGYLQHIFKQFGFETRVIPNIINLDRFRPQKHRLRYHLVITRNLEAIYGIKTAIDALLIIKKEYPDVRLTIAGSGPQEQELKQHAADCGLLDYINFTGRLKPDQVAELYREADIMLNPTTVDNMPNSILEAMASGVPVISTNVGGVPFIVQDKQTALLVDVNNPEQMARKTIELFQNTELYAKLVNNGLNEVKKYAWENVKLQWLAAYKECCEGA